MINLLKKYWKNEEGLSFMETAILFPVLLSLMMAVYDLGQGVIVNQKTVSASQIIADLVTRQEFVDQAVVLDIVNAGEMAFAPYSALPFGYDIASVEFDEDADPIVLWRMSDNMNESDQAIDSTAGLGEEGEGVVVVSVQYSYQPYFSNFVVEQFDMTERAFLRGRKSAVVHCSDCS